MRGLLELVRRKDPDIVLTQNGDSFYLPYLSHRAEILGMEFDLGREKGVRNAKGKSYFTYGRNRLTSPRRRSSAGIIDHSTPTARSRSRRAACTG